MSEMNSFWERLGATARAGTLLKILDGCRSGCFSDALRKSANSILTQELTILVVHSLRGQLPS